MGQLASHLRSYPVLALVAGVLALVLIAGLVLQFRAGPKANPPVVRDGVFDATTWDFATDGELSLSGAWQFTDISNDENEKKRPRFAPVPGAWPIPDSSGWLARKSGVAKYQLQLRLPKAPVGQRLALATGYWMSAFEVSANGQLLAVGGKVGQSPDQEWANPYSKIVAIPSGVEVVDLEVVVSNHTNRHVGPGTAPVVGIEGDLRSRMGFLETLSILMVGAMGFGALYHFVLCILEQRVSANFWFGAFAALLALRTIAIAPLAAYTVDIFEQYWVWRLNYACTMILLPTTLQFFLASFPGQIRVDFAQWLWWCFGALALVTVLSGPVVGEVGLKIVQIYGLLIMAYLSSCLFRSFRSGVPGASVALAGWLLCILTAVHDILMDNGVIASINLIPFGFMAFFLCLSGMLAFRHRDAFRQATNMTSRLQTLNEELEVAVQNRTVELEEKLEELSANQAALLQAREDAVSANIAKSRFLATMSHELRTPLNSILGFSEFIRDEKLGAVGDPRYTEYAGHIHESGEHLLALISDILDLSRIESGKLALRFEEIRVPDIIEAAIAKAATRERRAQDLVSVDVGANVPMMLADSRALTQMVINLVSNALKFTPDEGAVSLRAFVRADGGVTLAVADTGIGMAPEDIPRAIAAFSQIDNDLSRRHEGTGLGLTIVNVMMQQHGGSLVIESEKGKGTRVSLEFPAERSLPTCDAREVTSALAS